MVILQRRTAWLNFMCKTWVTYAQVNDTLANTERYLQNVWKRARKKWTEVRAGEVCRLPTYLTADYLDPFCGAFWFPSNCSMWEAGAASALATRKANDSSKESFCEKYTFLM